MVFANSHGLRLPQESSSPRALDTLEGGQLWPGSRAGLRGGAADLLPQSKTWYSGQRFSAPGRLAVVRAMAGRWDPSQSSDALWRSGAANWRILPLGIPHRQAP